MPSFPSLCAELRYPPGMCLSGGGGGGSSPSPPPPPKTTTKIFGADPLTLFPPFYKENFFSAGDFFFGRSLSGGGGGSGPQNPAPP